MLSLYQNIPLHIDPIAFAIGSFFVRWYALSYILGFLTVYLILVWRVRRGEFSASISNFKFQISNLITDFLLMAFFAALIGGRLGYILFYNFPYFFAHPLAIISPFENGNFVGFWGMSYHGALVGIVLGSWLFLRIKKINFWQWADFVVPAVPLGYFFGRIGNFLNGELYGRITNSGWGMHFATDPSSLRYPSQLFEAILEGLLLFIILWTLRNKKRAKGTLFSVYLIGYGIFRIISEQFREPDQQIGFLLGYITMGQALSFGMILIGLAILFLKNRKR